MQDHALTTALSSLGAAPDEPRSSGSAFGTDTIAAPVARPLVPRPWPAVDTNASVVDVARSSALRAPDRSQRDGVVLDLTVGDEPVIDLEGGAGWRNWTAAYVPVLRGRDRTTVDMLTAMWLVAMAGFWVWWLNPRHLVSLPGIVINSTLLFAVTTMPLLLLCAVQRLRRVNPAIPVPRLRVAMVATKAPSEPWSVVEQTLTALLAQDFPYAYDVWLCDEAPDEATYRWCDAHGVQISSRDGVDAYHRRTWPRRTRCKEGNLAYFYDHWGYRFYDVVAQFDADHVPAPSYLCEVVRAFADPTVGYVAAPSVCDANASYSWAARGRLYTEASLHGPTQAGSNEGWGPVCFGSHYAVRTRALRDIGGIGPELAEDFTTSYLMNVAGWSGAFALDAHASGDGPATFAAMAVQEFQWARSMCTVLLDLLPRTVRMLPWRLRLRYGYILVYYPMVAVTTVVGMLLPPIACFVGEPWVRVNYLFFLLAWWTPSLAVNAIARLLRRRGLLRPRRAKLLSWEGWLYAMSRWVFVARGVGSAVLQKIKPRQITFKVTPKQHGLESLPARLLLPYVAITILGASAHVVGLRSPATAGYALLSLAGSAVYLVVALACVVLHAVESRRATRAPVIRVLRTIGTALLVVGVQVAAVATAVVWGLLPWAERYLVPWAEQFLLPRIAFGG